MKADDMRSMTIEELQSHQDTLLDELVNLRIKLVVRQLDNPMKVRLLRRDIARTKTLLHEKMRQQAADQQVENK